METTQEDFQQLGTNKVYNIEYESDPPLGRGGQGVVYRIIKMNGILYGTWALKLLDDTSPQLTDRLRALVEFLEATGLNTEGLSCVPIVLLQSSGAGRLGIVMRCAPGSDIENSGGLPAGATLPKRLAAVHQLARSVRRLHSNGVIIGDLAHDNLIFHPRNWAPYLIDLDGSEFTQGTTYALIGNNTPKGELCPPEATPDETYTTEMDLWGLAVLIHYILTDENPMSCFGLSRNYNDPNNFEWPPPNHPQYQSHMDQMYMYGEPIADALRSAFNEGRLEPHKRPTAEKWEQVLAEAQRYIYVCNCSPDKPYVPLRGGWVIERCMMCQEPIAAKP